MFTSYENKVFSSAAPMADVDVQTLEGAVITSTVRVSELQRRLQEESQRVANLSKAVDRELERVGNGDSDAAELSKLQISAEEARRSVSSLSVELGSAIQRRDKAIEALKVVRDRALKDGSADVTRRFESKCFAVLAKTCELSLETNELLEIVREAEVFYPGRRGMPKTFESRIPYFIGAACDNTAVYDEAVLLRDRFGGKVSGAILKLIEVYERSRAAEKERKSPVPVRTLADIQAGMEQGLRDYFRRFIAKRNKEV